LCFGLNRDANLKAGQIAHIDRDASNDDLDNLVFLCFEHHDQYDSRTSQRKNFTPTELRHFREELDGTIRAFLSSSVTVGSAQIEIVDPVAGKYVRTSGPQDSAELLVERIGANKVRVTGLALFGLQREYGPNIGELDCEIELENDTAFYSFDNGQSKYWAEFHFTGGGAVVRERYSTGMFGMGASFDGVYRRVA
jgi:hypothetical protein